MISLSPFYLLIPFGAFLLGFAFFALANIISLAKYGARNAIGLLASFLFICGAAFILYTTWQALQDVAWTTPVPILSIQAFTL